MIYLLISIIFIVLEIILIGVFIGLAYKNNSFISKSTSGYIIPVALLSVRIISLEYIYPCQLEGKNIITKNEKDKFHVDLLSYYGLDDLNEYFKK